MKKVISLLMALVLTAALLSACGKTDKETSNTSGSKETTKESTGSTKGTAEADGAASGETVTISFFDPNSGSRTWNDRIAAEVTKRTGVNIEIQNPTGDPAEKLALMLAGQEYPDIVMMSRSSDIVNKYIEAGALLPLDDLLKEKGQNVIKMYGDTLNKTKYQDGKNYYLSNWYGPDPDPVAGFIMRYDYMVEIAGKERADSTKPFTQDEMIDILKKFKEKYPSIAGSDSIGLTMNGEQANYFNTIKGMYGMKTYYDNNGTLSYDVRDPKYIEMLKLMNQLYTEGLLDKEWVVNNTQLFTQKLSAGNVMGALCAYWDVGDANTSLKATDGEDAIFVGYKVLGNGIGEKETTYGGRSSLGWDAIGITNNCKNVDAAMKLIDYLASQEGQDLLLWGIEGEDWTMKDGVHVPNDEVVTALKTDYTKAVEDTGILKWTWFVKNSNHEDGTPSRISMTKLDKAAEIAWKNLTDTYWDTAQYDNLAPTGNSVVALQYQKVQDIFKQSFPKIVNASSADEVDSLYNKLIADMEAAGLKDVEAEINKNYEARKELWGIKY